MDEYLTISELSSRLKLKPKTIKNKMANGVFQRGLHYFSPQGIGPRFKWSAVVSWLEQAQEPQSQKSDNSIPMPKTYPLRDPNRRKTSIAS